MPALPPLGCAKGSISPSLPSMKSLQQEMNETTNTKGGTDKKKNEKKEGEGCNKIMNFIAAEDILLARV